VHHETMFQPDNPKPVAKSGSVASSMCPKVLLSCAVKRCKCQRERAVRGGGTGEDEGPNNIARQIAQMTRRFGNAEKDPSAPD
jgi:hypothetical protein